MGIMTALSAISQRKKTTAFHDQLIQLQEFLYEADKNGEPCGSSFLPRVHMDVHIQRRLH